MFAIEREEMQAIIERVRRQMGAPGCVTCKRRFDYFLIALRETVDLCETNPDIAVTLIDVIEEERKRGHSR